MAEMLSENLRVACVASVSVGLGSKERQRNGILPARNWVESQNKKEGGGEGRKRLQSNPWILKTSVRQRTGLVIGWTSQTLLTCVGHRSIYAEQGEACSQKFFAEQGFSHELRQYGGNPAVQCRRFGISKQAHNCPRKCDTVFVIFLIRCLKRLLPKFQRLPVVCLVTGDNTRNDFFPLACLANASLPELTLKQFGLILPCIILGPRGFFFRRRSCDSRDLDGTLDKNYLHIMFTQYTEALALMRGFAAHNRSFVKEILESLGTTFTADGKR